MVLYYSSTGNTEYIARMLAKEINDECTDLLERIREQDFTKIKSEKPFVICAPVYVGEMPTFLRDYLKRLPLVGSREVYFVFTDGGSAGIAGALAKTITVKKDMVFKGYADFLMPSNYIVNNGFPSTPHDECIRRIKAAADKVTETAKVINRGDELSSRHVSFLSKALTMPMNAFWTKFMQPSKNFHATDKCVGCGKCSKVCPLKNIRMENKKPRWQNPCAHCMACISNCPAKAIEYADITTKKEKYHIKKYLDIINNDR